MKPDVRFYKATTGPQRYDVSLTGASLLSVAGWKPCDKRAFSVMTPAGLAVVEGTVKEITRHFDEETGADVELVDCKLLHHVWADDEGA